MTDQSKATSRIWRGIRREPLVLFAPLGAGLYAVWAALMPIEVETVRIEAAALRGLERLQEELRGRPLSADERDALREGYIDDEILLREALRRGLQWSDSRVRQRLVRIMRGALTETVSDPSVAQLQTHFRNNIETYTAPESVTFEQVVFPWGQNVAEESLKDLHAQLRAGATPKSLGAASMSERRHMPQASRADLVRAFGADFANRVFALTTGEWHGPIESVRGIHLVRIRERHLAQAAAFEDIESYVREDWRMTRLRDMQQERIAAIRQTYRIELVEE